MDNIDLRPPYVIEYNKLCAFFEGDPTIEIGALDDTTQSCEVYVSDGRKANILSRALSFRFLHVDVIDGTEETAISADDMAYLLKDCVYFSELYTSETTTPKYSAVLMYPEVVKVNTDNFFSPTGCDGYTAQELARDLFHGNKINFQTDFVR